ncbi:hypothetical protein C0J52_16674, partial [Blattella germanica]
FSLGDFVKDYICAPPLPVNIRVIRHRITATVATVNRDIREYVWGEMNYRIDICHISKGRRIE